MPLASKGPNPLTAVTAGLRDQKRQNEKRFQEIEDALVLLLDAVEGLPVPEKHKKRIRKTQAYLENRLHRPRPPR